MLGTLVHSSLPVLFIHGKGSSKATWDGVIAHFDDTTRILALNLRGHGASQYDGEDFSPETLINDIKAYLDEEKIEKCILVAHSMGARIATILSAHYPDMVAGLLIEDMDMEPREKTQLTTEKLKVLKGFKRQHPSLESLKDYLKNYGYSSEKIEELLEHKDKTIRMEDGSYYLGTSPYVEYLTAQQVQETNAGLVAFEKIAHYNTFPVTLLYADDDSSVTPDGLRRMQQLMPQLSTICIPNSGHSIHKLNLPAYLEQLNSFVNKCCLLEAIEKMSEEKGRSDESNHSPSLKRKL